MKGLLLAKPGAPYELVDNLEKPRPGKNQILVKSLVTGINPVENIMQGTGQLVTAWPIVLGCDASGIVVETGEDTMRFKKGDAVFGCTRLGVPGYSTFQEYFLMDERLTFKKPGNISVEEAATVGVGSLTASLGLIAGTHLKFPEHPPSAANASEWILILGGAGGVGQYGIQIAKFCGYKVLTSCSPSNNKVVKSLGADAVFNYKISLEDQLAEIETITKRNFSRVFDASAMAAETAMESLKTCSSGKTKYFSTTDDWTPMESEDNVEIYRIDLGLIGRSGDAHAETINNAIESYIPKLENYLGNGMLKPMEYDIVGTEFEGVVKGINALSAGKGGGKKIVVRLQDN